MPNQIIETIQHAASGKTGVAVVATTVSAPAWIEILNGDTTRAMVILIGIVVSLTIIIINVQTFKVRSANSKIKERQEKIRTALLEHNARESGIDPDKL